MTRTDYLNDPNAPVPNSIVPAASAVVTNDVGEILLQRRSDNDLWALPGGTMDLGERIAETVVREVREETGLEVEVTGIVGVYSDPGHVIAYSDGEVRQEFNLCFAARLVGGQLSVSDESTEVRWVTPTAIEAAADARVDPAAHQALPGARTRAGHRLTTRARRRPAGAPRCAARRRPGGRGRVASSGRPDARRRTARRSRPGGRPG